MFCHDPYGDSLSYVDLSLDVHPVATAVAALLDARTINLNPAFSDIKVEDRAQYIRRLKFDMTPLYNCRERGLVLAVTDIVSSESFCVHFAEDRNSDSIFVEQWDAHLSINPPTLSDRPEIAYIERVTFPPNEITDAVSFIHDLIENKAIEYMAKAIESTKK